MYVFIYVSMYVSSSSGGNIIFANILCRASKLFSQLCMREISSTAQLPPRISQVRSVHHLIVFVAYSLGRKSMRVVRKFLSSSPKRTGNLPILKIFLGSLSLLSSSSNSTTPGPHHLSLTLPSPPPFLSYSITTPTPPAPHLSVYLVLLSS